MALIVVLVLLTIAIAAVLTFGDRAASMRLLRRIRLRPPRRLRLHLPRRHTYAGVPAASWAELTTGPSAPSAAMSFGAQDAESMLVALLLAGRLTRRDYQRQMAQLAAEDSAHGARP